ncbi:hypothetical protein CKO20_06260 [Rhodocyclus tenuis]|nr:hypothetical protein [Rhodocyclus tenuis]
MRELADDSDWDAAAALAGTIDLAALPPAQPADRAVLEQTLALIPDIDEKASWLKNDIGRLLKGFSGQQQQR